MNSSDLARFSAMAPPCSGNTPVTMSSFPRRYSSSCTAGTAGAGGSALVLPVPPLVAPSPRGFSSMSLRCQDVVTAGSDTSAAMMEWMLAELTNHPEALRKVREEIDAVVGHGRIAGEGDVASLPYLQAAYKETLRLHPAAPIAHRQSTEEMVFTGGFTVPPGTAVFINLWSIARDPAYWVAPLEFRPERFMGKEAPDTRGQHVQYLPFGAGRRSCPGMGLALQSVPAVVAALVQCFDGWVMTVDMQEGDGLVSARRHPLLLRLSPRLSPFPALV